MRDMNYRETENFDNAQQAEKFFQLVEKRKKLICELIADDMYVPMKEKELAAFEL